MDIIEDKFNEAIESLQQAKEYWIKHRYRRTCGTLDETKELSQEIIYILLAELELRGDMMFKSGDKVRHKTYGIGVIEASDDLKKAEYKVKFDKGYEYICYSGVPANELEKI